jgi:hypothetical protein
VHADDFRDGSRPLEVVWVTLNWRIEALLKVMEVETSLPSVFILELVRALAALASNLAHFKLILIVQDVPDAGLVESGLLADSRDGPGGPPGVLKQSSTHLEPVVKVARILGVLDV